MPASISPPQLRGDLVISRQETPGGTVFIVKDPQVGRFARFKEPEYFVAQQLDGLTPLEEVRRRGEERFGARLSEETLERFVGKLRTLGLLDTADSGELSRTPRKKPARLSGNVFCLRFKVIDPDRLLSWLVGQLSVLFTRTFAWSSVVLMLMAIGVTISSWQEVHRGLPRLYHFQSLGLAWLTLICVIIGHEFSHGLTCKRFGGKVHEIGLLLIYLQPAMYCNVSDAWLFPEKSKRLLVTFAGAWFDLLVWGLATLVWRITEPSTLPNYLALVVATTLGIKSLFNLNPLIKLDGYYLLSDFVEIPNLRRKAFTHIGCSLRKLWNPSQHTAESGTRREHRIYWLYGASAAVYSAWLIGFLLVSLGSFMMARYHGWGFAFFALLVGAIFRNSVQRSWHFLTSLFAVQQGIIRMLKRLAKIIVVLSIVSASLYFIRTDLRVSGEFAILPLHNADVRPDVEGIIEEIVHDEGETVEKGDLLVRLSDRDYRAELEKVSAEIAERAARLKLLRAGPRSEEIELAQGSVIKGEERLKFAQEYLSMEKTLFEEKLSSRKDLQLAKESAALRQKEIEESQGNLKLLLAGSRPEVIEATEAEMTRLVAQRKYLEDQLQRLRVVSPITGIITTHRLKEKLGATVKKGDLIAQVQEVNTVTAEISVPENEIADVQLGQSVLLKTRAHVRDSFQGTLVSISPVASKPADGLAQRNFLVVTQLDNSARLLKPEMSGNAKIYCGERRLYEIVFRRLVRYIRVEFWSWW